jgi:Tfp pilus assembly protein PilF
MFSRVRIIAVALAVFTAAAAPALARAPHGDATGGDATIEDARSEAKEQTAFGIKVAQNGLWKEAAYRWERAVQIDPTYAAAWNNLAIAYEQRGDFEKAREAYEKAVTLDPENLMFRQNYDLFKEINDRAKRRRDR